MLPTEDEYAELSYCHSKTEIAVRMIGNKVLNALPYSIYKPAVRILKQLRSKNSDDVEFSQNKYHPCKYAVRQADKNNGPLKLVITHDIDTKLCYDNWQSVIDVEKKYHVNSMSNVLTAGPYSLDEDFLWELEHAGFEIGLHGDNHDMAIGFRSEQEILRRIERCKELLPITVKGYRAPALAYSERLISCLEKLGFSYDSSIKAKAYYSTGVATTFPYKLNGSEIYEYPLSLQDDSLFVDAALSETDAKKAILGLLALYKAYGGVAVLNFHPIHLKTRMGFYTELIDQFSADKGMEVTTIRSLHENF